MATPDVDWDDEPADETARVDAIRERVAAERLTRRDVRAEGFPSLPAPEVLAQLLEGIGAATKPSTSLLSDGARQRAQALLVAGEALRGGHGHDPAGVERLAHFVMTDPPSKVGAPLRVPHDSHQA